MAFPDKIVVEVVPSAELERLHNEVAECRSSLESQLTALRGIYLAALEHIRQLETQLSIQNGGNN